MTTNDRDLMNPYLPRGSAADGPYALAVGPER